MKPKHFHLIAPAIAAMLMMASCSKDNIDPAGENYKVISTEELSEALACAKDKPGNSANTNQEL